ncbi:hypothetical protein [Lysinibacillus fusiformis]|uniref:hypothetical protein n=1 Tax=Lysinibacillus fusiformis TaxID=28031 RepID=UPI0035BFA539|nr:hypothetical protein QYY55_23130 [Lysinibacillus fusiformis]
MTNEKKKIKKKFSEVLTWSQSPNNGALAISFQEKTVLVNGVNSNSVTPHLAVLHASIGGKETFQYWTPISDRSNEQVVLAFNLKKIDNPILYTMNLHHTKNEALKFDKKTSIKEDDFILLYWEVEDFSFISMVFEDPSSNLTITECQFNIKYSSKVFNRKLLTALLPKVHATEIEKTLNKSEEKKYLLVV